MWVAYVHGQQPGPIAAKQELIKIKDDLYVIHTDFVPGNTTALITDEGVVLVDDKFGVDHDNIMAALKKVTDQPIRYVINSHVHFDHSGGLRTYVDEGATVVTHQMNQPYFEQAWAAPRTINPDRMALSKKAAKFETVTDKHVLTDGKRNIEIHSIAGSGHNDAFLMIYLPKEKILIEGDAFTPAAADAPPPAVPNPYTVNLYENIQRLKLDVRQIAAIHGPRVATMADLRTAIGVKADTN